MVCEFLAVEYKRRLLQIVTIEELQKVGYTKRMAYQAKEKGVISDDRCEELVRILGRNEYSIFRVIKDSLPSTFNFTHFDGKN